MIRILLVTDANVTGQSVQEAFIIVVLILNQVYIHQKSVNCLSRGSRTPSTMYKKVFCQMFLLSTSVRNCSKECSESQSRPLLAMVSKRHQACVMWLKKCCGLCLIELSCIQDPAVVLCFLSVRLKRRLLRPKSISRNPASLKTSGLATPEGYLV